MMVSGAVSAAPAPSETVVRLLELYSSGSTFPALAETGSGERFVLKLRATASGSRSLVTEFLGNRIAARLGLRVPSVRPVYIPADMPWEIGTDEFDDTLRRSAGWNLGVAHVDGARPLADFAAESLPQDFAARLAQIDDLLQNVDRTANNPNLLVANGDVWAIDFGGCLFLQRIIDGRLPYRFGLPGRHLLAGRENGPPRVEVAPEALAMLARDVPSHWIKEMGATAEEIESRLAGYVRTYSIYLEGLLTPPQ
jgi:hypothetical protein